MVYGLCSVFAHLQEMKVLAGMLLVLESSNTSDLPTSAVSVGVAAPERLQPVPLLPFSVTGGELHIASRISTFYIRSGIRTFSDSRTYPSTGTPQFPRIFFYTIYYTQMPILLVILSTETSLVNLQSDYQ